MHPESLSVIIPCWVVALSVELLVTWIIIRIVK